MRGEDVRKCELADLFCLNFENEGFTPCTALVVIMDHGKTNQFGRKELGACIRYRDVELCPVGAVALYLLSLWDLLRSSPPDMSSSRKWFNIKLVPGRKGSCSEITYQSHLNAFKQCFML